MSTPVMYLVDDAAQAIGDPNKQRVGLPQWLSIYNRSDRELCQKVNLLKYQDIFTLVANQARYDYPEQMTVLTGIEVSQTPADELSFRSLDEMFEDEFRRATSGLYPKASLPTHYFAGSNWFYLIGAASAEIVEGGVITYFGVPDDIVDLQTAIMQVDDFARDYLTRRMIIHGYEARNRWNEASAALQMWNADIDGLQDKMEDRSQDRRSSLAPRKPKYQGMR